MAFENPDDGVLRELLSRARRIAVVGLSPKPERESHHVASYLQQHGYEIDPVYPREETILGRTVYRRLEDVPPGVDVVDVFRRGTELPEVVDDVLASGFRAVWFQLGCVNEAAAERAREAGLTVVMDRCMKMEHSRLLGAAGRRS
jgi:predicted CoA-binding protein